jgi:hypothetical protein
MNFSNPRQLTEATCYLPQNRGVGFFKINSFYVGGGGGRRVGNGGANVRLKSLRIRIRSSDSIGWFNRRFQGPIFVSGDFLYRPFLRNDSLVSRSFFGLKFRLLYRKMVSDSLKQISLHHFISVQKYFLVVFFTSPKFFLLNELYHLVFPKNLCIGVTLILTIWVYFMQFYHFIL